VSGNPGASAEAAVAAAARIGRLVLIKGRETPANGRDFVLSSLAELAQPVAGRCVAGAAFPYQQAW
jgi:uncharacterized membrane protein